MGQQRSVVFFLTAVDGHTAGIHKLTNARLFGRFKDVDRAHHIDGRAQWWVGPAEGDLQRSQVNDVGGSGIGDRAGNYGRVRNIAVHKSSLRDFSRGHNQFQPVAVMAQVKDRHRNPFLHQVPNNPGPNTAHSAGDKKML